MSEAPAKHFEASQDNKVPSVDSAFISVEGQFKQNAKEGDACAAYSQMREEVLKFEAAHKDNKSELVPFINDLSKKLQEDGLLPAVQIAAVRYAEEEKSFVPSSEADKVIRAKLDNQEKDGGIQYLEQALIKPVLNKVAPEKYSEVLSSLKSEYIKAHQPDSLKSTSAVEKDAAKKSAIKSEANEASDPVDKAKQPTSTASTERAEKAQQDIVDLKKRLTEVPKGSWDEATSLYALGTIEGLVQSSDARQHLKQAVELMRGDLTGQPELEVRSRTAGSALSDYADYLTSDKPNEKQSKEQVLADRSEADKIFDELLKLAPQAKLTDLDQAEVYRRKGDNQIFLGSGFDISTVEGKASYRQQLEQSMATLEQGIAAISNNQTNDGIASRALLTGDKGFVAASLADKPGDSYAVAAQRDYQAALKLWGEFNPAGGKDADENRQLADSSDKAQMVLLSNYIRLLTAENKATEIEPLKTKLQQLLDRHPDMTIRR